MSYYINIIDYKEILCSSYPYRPASAVHMHLCMLASRHVG